MSSPVSHGIRAAGLLGQVVEADYRVVAATLGVLLVLVTLHLLRRGRPKG